MGVAALPPRRASRRVFCEEVPLPCFCMTLISVADDASVIDLQDHRRWEVRETESEPDKGSRYDQEAGREVRRPAVHGRPREAEAREHSIRDDARENVL